jgi:hypothetical protein
LSFFPNPWQHHFRAYVLEQQGQVLGFIQIAPFNDVGTTWQVYGMIMPSQGGLGVGADLLQYVLETVQEARNWVLEVDIHDQSGLALSRQHGFQPLAQKTYWLLAPETLHHLASQAVEIAHLYPLRNAIAPLLCQLDMATLPPLVRQVFDRHLQDFQHGGLRAIASQLQQRLGQGQKQRSGYVFEPQRKVAIGQFQLELAQTQAECHIAQLTVHPAYTWLYPKLFAHIASLAQADPPRPLRVVSADYQPEREKLLAKIGAEPVEQTLLMSRSLWHRLREIKPTTLEGLSLVKGLPRLHPSREPMPGRMVLPRAWAGAKSPPLELLEFSTQPVESFRLDEGLASNFSGMNADLKSFAEYPLDEQ